MLTFTATTETITASTDYPKVWKRDDTGVLYFQGKASHDLLDPATGVEISKAALSSGYTEQQKWTLEGSNLSTVS
jgi:hypothetical protein